MNLGYDYLAGKLTIELVKQHASLPVFSPAAIDFLTSLSKALLSDEQSKRHPELVALGFWLRGAHLSHLQTQLPSGLIKPLGCVVHYTPSNVDTMFIYSWVCALLMGNLNLVRVSNTQSFAKQQLLDHIGQLFSQPEHQSIAQRNGFIYYDYNQCNGQALSAVADARVIWGGDESVSRIRALTFKPRCRDISFADRFSACLINGDELDRDEDVTQLATNLAKDIQPFSQQACSSPKVIFWLGSDAKQSALFEQVDRCFEQNDVNVRANQLATAQYLQAINGTHPPVFFKQICIQPIESLEDEMIDGHNGQAHCLIKKINNIEEMALQISDKLQTLSVWGVDKQTLLKLVADPSITGIDRVVPVGQALDFNVQWDGYDLLMQLSRIVKVD